MLELRKRSGQVAQVVERSPEKAGVGGSTPSLATIILKNLAEVWRLETSKITHACWMNRCAVFSFRPLASIIFA